MSAGHADTGNRHEGPAEDAVGIGFGPANLALAVAIAEHNSQGGTTRALRTVFVERQPEFGWHRGMLLPGATMQVSFLKDLATMRDPGSRFTFLRYLHERGRLADFINQKSFFPTRLEFHDYLRWCAAMVAGQVRYGREVGAIRPVEGEETVDTLEVVTRAVAGAPGEEATRTRNVVVGTGLVPRLPEGVSPGPRVWHSSDLLPRANALTERPHRRFVVVGAGQSGAETAEFLHREFPDAEVCAVFSRYGYSPADDSPFANRIFDPVAVDDFYAAPDEVKERLLTYHANTNYSVVDGELIEQLYRTAYQEKVAGAERLRILNTTALTAVEERPDGARAVLRPLIGGEPYALDCDAVVLATGYRPSDPRTLLGPLADECLTDGRGRLRIGRDHRVETTPRVRAGIYLQGAVTEHSHGITSSLLSTLAVRAGEICDALLLDRAGRDVPEADDVAVPTV
ncbi:lysine N(6)-hydroxylase/L-ornithine N(5)-oxygenase family protein [Streptomyces sp. SID8499]|uniref:lysine N(6)-hydroxylase/L-ornithine N(5)-oxygenase family protein n=1 Tax=Streptomyces sp. SID8499 TaxID=2706106 RepID=UPI0013C858CC|nr:lysine N(6)-hydroxylase/L-ornithine N(5)-oxygenase family protein [Streptomyces sp. SID8499]NED36834.1 lysine N(6)-hydroxylase/L-ornithine N(5)-oxygenase family protein [Streptomyces sp. SID8499]